MRSISIAGIGALLIVGGLMIYFYTRPPQLVAVPNMGVNISALPSDARNGGQAVPEPLSGIVESITDTTLAINDKDGTTHTAQLADKVIIQTLVAITLTDIQPGDNAMVFGTSENNSFHAVQVRISRGKVGFMGGGLPIETGASQDPNIRPKPLLGIVEQVNHDSFVIKSRDGNTSTMVDIIDAGTIVKQQDAQITDIQSGDTLMTVGMKDHGQFQVIQIMKINNDLSTL